MSPLACFCRPSSRHRSKAAPEDDDEWEDDLPARLSADSDGGGGGGAASPAAGRDKQARKNTHLFKDKRVLTRPAAKDKLKKIINVKKSGGGLDSPDHEFQALAKIYSEGDALLDLIRTARNRDSLSHLLPFVMNALLYGFRDDDDSVPAGKGGSASGAAYSKKHSALTGLFGSRSADVSQPRHLSLNGASHLVKAQCERQLENFIHQQAMRSVGFALECAWYLTTSLLAGPPSAYHHTMTLLLSMESVVTNYTPPGDLFKKADLHGDRVEAPSTAVPSSPPRSALPGASTDPVAELELPTLPSTAVTAPSPTAAAGGGGEIVEEGDGFQLVLDTTGDGERDLTIAFPAIEGSDEAQLRQWLVARSERSTIFHAELDFIKCLTDISNGLFSIDREFRRDVLRRELEKLNSHIPKNVFLPTEKRAHRILRIVPEAAHVFSTKERVPYLMVVEVEDLGPPEDAPGTLDKKSMADKKSIGKGEEGKRRKGHTGSGPGPMASAEDIVAAGGEAVAAGDAGGVKGDQGDDAAPNMPEDKFEFLPEMTTTDSITGIDVANFSADMVASEAGGPGGVAVGAVSCGASPSALSKRISSFHVDDTEYDDDRRPPDEELIKALGEPWAVKTERMRKESPYGSNPKWRLISCIVKARDQLRQEMFAQRLIQELSHIFIKAKLPLRLQPYNIIATSSEAGLIETLYDAKSIDSIKKDTPNVVTLQDYFIGRFGGRGSSGYKKAVKAFVQSMAGYAVVSYLLNIKDRHNGNLMICADGAIVHIDFGFCRFLRGNVLAFLSFWSTLSTELTFLLLVCRTFSAVQLAGWEHGVRACAF